MEAPEDVAVIAKGAPRYIAELEALLRDADLKCWVVAPPGANKG